MIGILVCPRSALAETTAHVDLPKDIIHLHGGQIVYKIYVITEQRVILYVENSNGLVLKHRSLRN